MIQKDVLIIDDDEDMLEVISVSMKKEGYHTATAQTGKEALEKLKEDSFDIAIVDIKMPDISGVDILETIKENNPNTRIVMITGHATVETAVSTLKSGAYDYITKPFKMANLKEIIRKPMEEPDISMPQENVLIMATHDGVFTFQNQAHLDMFGYTNEELYGKLSYLDLVAEKEKMSEEVFPSIIQGGWRGELTGIRKDGAEFPTYASCSPVIDKDGNVAEFARIRAMEASIIDLMETKELQAQLIRTEKLAALGQMVHGIAHNMNNHLAPVLGYAELAKMYVEANNRESLLHALQTIEQSARDTAAQIRRLQEYARVQKDTRRFVPLDLNEIVKDALKLTQTYWREEAQFKGISYALKVDYDENLPPLMGEPEAIRDTVINVVKNAIEAMPGGGDLLIKIYRGDDYAVVEISDTGIGMSPDTQRRIFDPYFTTKGAKGTGLGLSESFGAITRHGGTIDVESIEEEGTTFYIRLPIPQEETPEVTEDEKERPEYSMSILIIDDDNVVRKVLGDMVRNIGGHYQVDVVSSGEEGIEMAARQPYDVVITDVAMPDMNGWEVARYLRDNYPQIVVGFVTGFGISLNEEEIEEAGVSFTLAKPLSADQIQDALVSAYELRGEKAGEALSLAPETQQRIENTTN